MAMSAMTSADDLTGLDIERCKKRGDAMAQVVVRLPFRNAWTHRKDRLRAVQRLYLGLLIDAEHDRILRRRHIQSDDVTRLLDEKWISRKLERFAAAQLSPNVRHIREIVACESPSPQPFRAYSNAVRSSAAMSAS